MAQARERAYVLNLPTEASLASVRAALARSESCEALLVFPPFPAVELAQLDTLAALRAFCREQEIDAVVIGGDEMLRAVAVAAGFAAATSIAAWEASAPEAPAAFVHPTAEEWAAADAALVGASAGRSGDSGSGWHANPPHYVMQLLGTEGGYAGPRDELTPQEAERLPLEDDATDPLLRAHHDYEERITTTIRDTGRLPLWRPSESVPAH